jgi:NAD-dependent deacetylase
MNVPLDSKGIRAAARLLRQSAYTVALTGAGISVPSGIPDFRSQGSGLWERSNPMEVASLSAFRYRPEAFFNWLRPLARDMLAAQPNPAHLALAEMEANGWLKAVITQNIDDLHQRAGSSEVIEVHGTTRTLTCLSCHNHYELEQYRARFIEAGELPRCAGCGSVLKPDVVLFEEMLPMDAWDRASEHMARAETVLVVGTSLEVAPASQLPLYALRNGARLIINTLSETYLDEQADVLLPYDVAQAIPAIVTAMRAI